MRYYIKVAKTAYDNKNYKISCQNSKQAIIFSKQLNSEKNIKIVKDFSDVVCYLYLEDRINNESLPKLSFSDDAQAVSVEVLQILFNEKVLSKDKIFKHQFDDVLKSGKNIIYFELKITNNKYDGALWVAHLFTKLESTSGETFSSQQSRDYFNGQIHRGRSIRGGVWFEIYKDSIPSFLRYDIGLQSPKGKIEAISPELGTFFGIPK